MMVLEDFIYLITDAHNFDDTAKKQFSTQRATEQKTQVTFVRFSCSFVLQ
jgi:uncharacterized protein YegL